jgi:hypothetical protein
MRSTGRTLAGVVVAVAVLAATAQGVSAAPATSGAKAADRGWEKYPCDAAAFLVDAVDTSWSPDQPDVLAVRAPGEVACGVPKPGPRYAFAIFWVGTPLGYINLQTASLQYGPTAPSPFLAIGGVRVGQPAAICVVADTYVRLACLYIQAPGRATGLAVRALPTSDPIVTGPVLITRRTNDPSCATCWTSIDPT